MASTNPYPRQGAHNNARKTKSKSERSVEENLSMDKKQHIEKVADRDLLTLNTVTNGGCNKTMNQAHGGSSETILPGLPSHIITTRKHPNRHIIIPLRL